MLTIHKSVLAAFLVSSLTGASAFAAPISLTGGACSQNFNSLNRSSAVSSGGSTSIPWMNGTTLQGWSYSVTKPSTGVATPGSFLYFSTYTTAGAPAGYSSGTSNQLNAYSDNSVSFPAPVSSPTFLETIPNINGNMVVEIAFQNNTGAAITSLTVGYRAAERKYSSGTGIVNTLGFNYLVSTSATETATDGTAYSASTSGNSETVKSGATSYTAVSALSYNGAPAAANNFSTPHHIVSGGSVTSSNTPYTDISGTVDLSATPVAAGSYLYFAFDDAYVSSGTHAFDVTNFNLSYTTAPAVPEPASLGILSIAGLGLLTRKRRS